MFTFIISFQDSVYNVSNGNNESEQTPPPPPKTPKKTLIERTLDKFSSTGSISKSGKQVYPSKGNHNHTHVPYPISQIEGRWMYQQPPQHYVYHHHRQSNHQPQAHKNQNYHPKSPKSFVYNQHPVWIPNYSFSPSESPPIDYECSDSLYDRYGGTLCSHIDKYGTQRGSKYTTNSHGRRECKKCISYMLRTMQCFSCFELIAPRTQSFFQMENGI